MQWALIRIGIDLGVFATLSANAAPVGLSHFVKTTSASPTLLAHLLRSMAAFGFIIETEKDTFTANHVTKAMAQPDVVGALPHVTDVHALTAQVLPRWLKEHNYQDMTDSKDLPFHSALKTDLLPFEWMKQNSEQMKALGHAMKIERMHSWVDSYPIEKEIGNFEARADSALLVDVGGGFGQQSTAFRSRVPSVPGRIIVQDVASTLAYAPKNDGLEFQEHDFFTPQPIKGAKFYYLRHILHDWTDEDSVRILKNLVPALTSESRIVIDEVVLPDTNVPWQCAFMDLSMSAALGGCERSRDEWQNLLDRAGLKTVEIHTYDDVRRHSVIVAVSNKEVE
jgi:demethylsterigmatocystin 6-O-methyltransferase